jgi:phospholipase/lecithinase/hemolysin
VAGLDPAVPPSISPHRTYFGGRFSNGPVAFEYLWEMVSGNAIGSRRALRPFLQPPFLIRNQAVNFAFGGSGTGFVEQTPGGFEVPGLLGQIELFRAALPAMPGSRALYAIFAGANDYLGTSQLSPAESVGNIITAVRQLYDFGARDIIVVNLPDLGRIPLNAGLPQSKPLSDLTRLHNDLLASQLTALAAALPDLNLIPIDLNAVLTQLPTGINATVPAVDVLVPPRPGLPPTSVCIFVNPATCPDVPTFDVGLQFLFWDAEHPTTAVHQLLGQYIFGQLVQAVGRVNTTSN